jgi:acetyl-CoA C-acetyltransferase
MRSHAAVAGVGITPATSPGRQTASKIELCQEAIDAALEHAGCRRQDVDAIVFGNIDPFEAVNVSGKTIAPSLGLRAGTPVYIVNTGGNTGGGVFNLGVNLVQSGEYERVLCVGPPTFDGPIDLAAVINKAVAVAMESPLGMAASHIGGMNTNAYQQDYDCPDEILVEVTRQQREYAMSNPFAHIRSVLPPELASRSISTPLTLSMVCPVSSGAAAVLVTTEDVAGTLNNPVVRVAGHGSIGDTYLGSGRHSMSSLEVLAMLADRVYKDAGVMDPRREIDLAEVFAPFAPLVLILLEDLQMCGRGKAPDLVRSGELKVDGSIPTNLSGGPHSSNAGVAGQLAPVVYVARQLMGQALGGVQVPDARRGLAHSMGSSWWQFHTLTVLERVSA